MDIRDEKKRLRASIDERMARLSEKDRETESRSLCRRILESLPADVQTVCAYYPMRSEADIKPLLAELLARGIALYLPCFAEREKVLVFRRALDLTTFIKGKIGTLEPPRDAPPLDPLSLDLAIIPARAFDDACWRLGRGNGGYDVWIRAQRALNPKTRFWGAALDLQLVREVPHEAHDEKVDAVVTARGLRPGQAAQRVL